MNKVEFVLPPPITDLREIGVDLDNTLAKGVWSADNPSDEIGDPIARNVRQLERIAATGEFKIVIWTARADSERHRIAAWLKHHSIPYDRIDCGKPLRLMTFDDRAASADTRDWLATVRRRAAQ